MDKKQQNALRQKAHKLKPVVIIGNNELTEAVHLEIDGALDAHELIKVRVNAQDKEHRQQMITSICEQQQAELIQTIGHIVTLYRAHS